MQSVLSWISNHMHWWHHYITWAPWLIRVITLGPLSRNYVMGEKIGRNCRSPQGNAFEHSPPFLITSECQSITSDPGHMAFYVQVIASNKPGSRTVNFIVINCEITSHEPSCNFFFYLFVQLNQACQLNTPQDQSFQPNVCVN